MRNVFVGSANLVLPFCECVDENSSWITGYTYLVRAHTIKVAKIHVLAHPVIFPSFEETKRLLPIIRAYLCSALPLFNLKSQRALTVAVISISNIQIKVKTASQESIQWE